MNLRFDLPWMVLLAALLPLVSALAFWWWHRRRVSRLAALGGQAAIDRLTPVTARRAPVARAARFSLALGLAALAFAGPRWGSGSNIVRSEGIDVVLAMDASLSMLATDERPSRLERMKQEIRRFRAAAPGNRVALLAFAGRSYILTPLTADDGALELFLDNLDPSIVGQPGTAMAPTIHQGVDLLRAARGAAGRALVILSDGEAFDDHAESRAEAVSARDAGIAVVTVGFGTEAGSTIPILDGTQIVEKRDEQGQIVVTKYDPAFLREVATSAGGEFVPATATDKATRIHQALSRLDAQQRSVEEGMSRPLRVTWLLFPVFLLLLFDAWRADGGNALRLRRLLRLTAPALLLLVAFPRVDAQQGDPPSLYRAGRYAQAIARWRQLVADGDRRPVTLYNLGTALLAADSLNAAAEFLERAATTGDSSVRQRALYNLGLAQLKRGSRGDASDPRALDGALAAYRSLLLQRPDDGDAKWNYELALKQKQSGGGGGGGSRNDPQNQPQQQRGEHDDTKGMSKQQAEQLLSAASRDEKETQARRQKGMRQERAPGGKDW